MKFVRMLLLLLLLLKLLLFLQHLLTESADSTPRSAKQR